MAIDHTPSQGSFRIDPETQRRIEAHARAAGITPADLVRRAFEEYETTHESKVTAFDVLSRAGLIGCLRGTPETPTDLATNPDHMQGFGGE
jgi:predicted DNA-binding protein